MELNEREKQLKNWLSCVLRKKNVHYELLSGDASFRQYFRVYANNRSFVVMDAPPHLEASQPFVAIANTFRSLGLNTPEIYEADFDQGFLLLSDFGDQLYLKHLNMHSAEKLYQQAFDALTSIARCKQVEGYELPHFSAKMYQKELDVFCEWYLQRYLGVKLSACEERVLAEAYQLLIQDALLQPQVCVHRDYHSRNLMIIENQKLGILDFQDAVIGPITYDILSLLRDCYIDWPPAMVTQWVLHFQQQLLAANLLTQDDPQQFLRWFDWIGLQRNIKCIGIFARLNLRDNKPGYLQDIPRVLNYAKQVCVRYPEFEPLTDLFEKYSVVT